MKVFSVSQEYMNDRQSPVERTWHQRLATAVIERAVLDAAHVCVCQEQCECELNRTGAMQFLSEGDEDLAFWCELAGLDVNAVRDRYARRT